MLHPSPKACVNIDRLIFRDPGVSSLRKMTSAIWESSCAAFSHRSRDSSSFILSPSVFKHTAFSFDLASKNTFPVGSCAGAAAGSCAGAASGGNSTTGSRRTLVRRFSL